MPKQKTTKKERRIFWSGALTGIVGGIIGNLFVGYLFRLSDNITNHKNLLVDLSGTIFFTLLFFAVLFFINKQIKLNK